MMSPQWGQSNWSSTLRGRAPVRPYNAWGEPAPMHKPDYDAAYARTPTEAERTGAEAAERLYSNRRHYSDSTKRWRTGTQCRRPEGWQARRSKKDKRPTRAAPPAPPSPAPAKFDAASPELWAENVTRRRRKPEAEYREKPTLCKQKQRDYGAGIPNWSPYNNSKSNCISRTTANQEYGEFSKQGYLKDLAALMAAQGKRSSADMKAILDPSSAMHCAVKEYKTYD